MGGLSGCPAPGIEREEEPWDLRAWRTAMLQHAAESEAAVERLRRNERSPLDDLPNTRLADFHEAMTGLEESVPGIGWGAPLVEHGRRSHYRGALVDMRYAAGQLLRAREADDEEGVQRWSERLERSLDRWDEIRAEWIDPIASGETVAWREVRSAWG